MIKKIFSVYALTIKEQSPIIFNLIRAKKYFLPNNILLIFLLGGKINKIFSPEICVQPQFHILRLQRMCYQSYYLCIQGVHSQSYPMTNY